MLDQLYTLELLKPAAGLRVRSGCRKRALRVRRSRHY